MTPVLVVVAKNIKDAVVNNSGDARSGDFTLSAIVYISEGIPAFRAGIPCLV